MRPEMKYYILMSAALIIGFGGFIVLALVVLPTIEKGSLLMPLLFIAWAAVVAGLLFWRYRVGKNDPGIVAKNKKDAQAFSEKLDAKAEKRARRRNRGAYGGELYPPVDLDEEEEEDEETPAGKE